MDQDTTTTTGSEAAGLPAGRWNSPLEDVLCRELWQDKAAGWVEVSWRHVNELRADVAEMLALPPGPDLLLAVERVQRDLDAHGGHCSAVHTFNVWGPVGTPGNPCECQVITAAAWQAVASWTQFRADRHLVSTAGARPHQVPLGSDPDRPSAQVTDPGAEELALGLRASATGLRTRLNRARRRHDYPRLCAAVAAGCLPGWQADVLLDDLVNFPDPVVDAVLDSLLDTMADRRTQEKISWTLTSLRQAAKRRAARLDDRSIREQRRQVHRNRGMRTRCHGNGAATITVDLTDDVATRIRNRITALARGLTDAADTRTLTQKQVDVLTDLLLSHTTASPAAPGSSDEIAVVISTEALMGLTGDSPHLPSGDPVPVDIAREIAADARWRLWLTDTHGTVVATSAHTYRPGAALARLIRAREPHCRMPGCRSTATDIDHTINYPTGATTPDNLGPLCRRHHNLKTDRAWDLINNPDGTYTWTTAAGIPYTDDAPVPLRL